MVHHMLTTIDNPWNPFTHFTEWYVFDEKMGYQTSGLLARLVQNSDDISQLDQDLEIENVIDEIVRINASGMHTKVAEPGADV